MIWLILLIAIGLLLVIAIENQFPDKHNVGTLLMVVVLWPVLLIALALTNKDERMKRWRK